MRFYVARSVGCPVNGPQGRVMWGGRERIGGPSGFPTDHGPVEPLDGLPRYSLMRRSEDVLNGICLPFADGLAGSGLPKIFDQAASYPRDRKSTGQNQRHQASLSFPSPKSLAHDAIPLFGSAGETVRVGIKRRTRQSSKGAGPDKRDMAIGQRVSLLE